MTVGRLDWKRRLPPSKAKRQKPAKSKGFLYCERNGMRHRGRRPKRITPSGNASFEPK